MPVKAVLGIDGIRISGRWAVMVKGDRMDTGRNSSQKGYSLVEMLIASLLFLIVITAMLALFSNQTAVARQANQRTDLLANARAAMDVITKDLRMAGANLPDGAVYAFIDGDNAGTGSSGDGLQGGSDSPGTWPDHIQIMFASGEGPSCSFSLGESMPAGSIQSAVLPVPNVAGTPSDLRDLMIACASSYRWKVGAGCNDLWIVESDDGSFQTIIEARQGGSSDPDDAYNVTANGVNVQHTPDSGSDVNAPTGLPGSPQQADMYRGGRIRLANDFKRVAYRIGNQNSDHPTLQRAEANSCSKDWDSSPADGAPDDNRFVTIAENVEDLQFSFAYVNPGGESDNLNAVLESGGGSTPYFRYPSSYNLDQPVSPPAGYEPRRMRYVRVTMIVRTELVDSSKRGYGTVGGGEAVDDITSSVTDFKDPVFFNRPKIENRNANTTLDGRARVFLQEVVDLRNLNLPPV